MSLHKLTAGDGYTYLTRQVAAQDATERGYSSPGDYYAGKGESPGIWAGGGIASLDLEGQVTETQMKNLFGRPAPRRGSPGSRGHRCAARQRSRCGATARGEPCCPAGGAVPADRRRHHLADRLTAAYEAWSVEHDHDALWL